MKDVHFSSQRLNWRTPKALYDLLDKEFNFDYDPCPPDHKVDTLKIEWGNSNFVNPPYGKEIGAFIAKGYEQWQKGKTVVLLIPSRTDTSWWHDYCMDADEVRFIRGRLKFDDQDGYAPFPSAVVIFRGETADKSPKKYILTYEDIYADINSM